MNALQSYSSDDESGNEAPMHKNRKSADPGTNYDDVGMDISEDSDDELPHHNQQKEKGNIRPSSSSARPPGASPPGSSPRASPHITNHNEAKEGQRSRSRSRSRERETGRLGQQSRDHTNRNHPGRDQVNQGHTGRGRDSRDVRRSRDDERKRRDDERRSRRSRSRSRSRERRRSRSRSRDRRSRSRSRERRRRSRSRERKRPMDIRKEAQQKLAALKAANPDLTAAELLKRSMEAQREEVQKQTGITLPSYYNPAAMNPMKFAEQERKKKLLWGNKNKPPTESPICNNTPEVALGGSTSSASFGGFRPNQPISIMGLGHRPLSGIGPGSSAGSNSGGGGGIGGVGGSGQAALWANTRFSNDKDGKMAEKFRRLMGVKTGGETTPTVSKEAPAVPGHTRENPGIEILQKQETMFTSMERQYEMARIATHTHKGFGLGFTSQSFVPK